MASRAGADRLNPLGIRHHGPGSAASVERALSIIDPAIVLIEGPPEANAIAGLAANEGMRPPLALMVYADEAPMLGSFYPMAIYSPEWRALLWALRRSRPVRFIDLPATYELARRKAEADAPESAPSSPGIEGETSVVQEPIVDPLGTLAVAAGYQDGETWWNALVEQGVHGVELFVAIERAMTSMRSSAGAEAFVPDRDARREAAMRLAIAEALRETDGAVAVITGAWHVPALRLSRKTSEDRALVGKMPRLAVTATWVPWTDLRLTTASGYGAGIASPGWYRHIWEGIQAQGEGRFDHVVHASRWQAAVADQLRKAGLIADTASVIEAARLGSTLAAMRGLSRPGLPEMQDASLATLCQGLDVRLSLIKDRLVVGDEVGEVAEGVPQTPLQADLARHQARLKLKPTSRATELALDLRTEAGHARSTLLHRLNLIGVPWGTFTGSGSSRGTFREQWQLQWKPELSVGLVDALGWGTTIETAASAKALATPSTDLAALSQAIMACLDADLPDPAERLVDRLQAAAMQGNELADLLEAVPPLANVVRYGTARRSPREALTRLARSLSVEISVGLVPGCQGIDARIARMLTTLLGSFDRALALLDDSGLTDGWRTALTKLSATDSAAPMTRGFAVRSLYDCGRMNSDGAGLALSRALSPTVDPSDAAFWLEGFLDGVGTVLLHDKTFLTLIDNWLLDLSEENFVALLPALRRSTAILDREERRRILEAVETRADGNAAGAAQEDALIDPAFDAMLPLLAAILGPRTGAGQGEEP